MSGNWYRVGIKIDTESDFMQLKIIYKNSVKVHIHIYIISSIIKLYENARVFVCTSHMNIGGALWKKK